MSRRVLWFCQYQRSASTPGYRRSTFVAPPRRNTWSPALTGDGEIAPRGCPRFGPKFPWRGHPEPVTTVGTPNGSGRPCPDESTVVEKGGIDPGLGSNALV